MRFVLTLVLILTFVMTGCGFWRGEAEDPRPSIADAETCADVADVLAFVAQDFIDDAERAGMNALAAGPDSELFQRYVPQIEAVQIRAEELDCDEATMRPLVAERLRRLETTGPIGNLIVDLLYQQFVEN